MPWCPGCDRFLSPSTVSADGRCPRCDASVDPGRATAPRPETETRWHPSHEEPSPTPAAGGAAASDAEQDDEMPLPWHFKMLVGAIALYLGWRAFQGVEWLAHHL